MIGIAILWALHFLVACAGSMLITVALLLFLANAIKIPCLKHDWKHKDDTKAWRYCAHCGKTELTDSKEKL
jgi:hypothetical protein